MNQGESTGFWQAFLGHGFQPRPYLVVVAAIFLTLVLFHFLRKTRGRRAIVDDSSARTLRRVAVETPGAIPMREADYRPSVAREPRRAVEDSGKPAGSEQDNTLPQDSVLRRHHVTHVRYMIESVTFPRPTDSVLRRHYDQLVSSELDRCLNDGANLERLVRRYESARSGA